MIELRTKRLTSECQAEAHQRLRKSDSMWRLSPLTMVITVGSIFLSTCPLSKAQDLTEKLGSEAKEVLWTDNTYREAILRSDIKSLINILREDIVIVHSDGTTDNGTNFLEGISSGRLKLQSYRRSHVSVHIFGSTALLVSQTQKHFTYKGEAGTDDDTSLVTYVKEGVRWRMVAMQNTHRSN